MTLFEENFEDNSILKIYSCMRQTVIDVKMINIWERNSGTWYHDLTNVYIC